MVGIGFFAPLPLALMMPFMAGQSMMMGDAFGKAYQYGKRKISAMSNEEFNKMSVGKLGQEILTDYTAIIPSMTAAIQQSTAFQSFIIHELATIIKNLPKDLTDAFGVSPTSPEEILAKASQNITPTSQSNLVTKQDLLDTIETFYKKQIATETGSAIASGVHTPSATVVKLPPVIPTTLSETLKIATSQKTPTFIGPTQTPRTGTSTANRLIVNKQGQVTGTIDTRVPVVKDTRIRAPSSILLQHRKLLEQIRIANLQLNTVRGSSNSASREGKRKLAQFGNVVRTATAQIATLKKKYRI